MDTSNPSQEEPAALVSPLLSFTETMLALRSISAADVSNWLNLRYARIFQGQLIQVLSGRLTREGQEALADLFEQYSIVPADLYPSAAEDPGQPDERGKAWASRLEQIQAEHGSPRNAAERPRLGRDALLWIRLYHRPRPSDLVNRSVLVTVISAFEGLLSAVVQFYLRTKPEVMRSSEREFSLAELTSMSRIGDAIEMAIESRVESLLRGGITDWAKWFKRELAIDPADLAIDWARCVEAFERRNAIIHTQSRVSHTYQRRISSSSQLGQILIVDQGYLNDALEEIATLGWLLAVRVWTKVEPRSTERAIALGIMQTREFATLGYWRAVQKLNSVLRRADVPIRWRLQCKVQEWLARSHLYGKGTIHSEIAGWDVSALSVDLKAAKALLMGDLTTAEAHVREAADLGLITKDDFKQDELYAELRG